MAYFIFFGSGILAAVFSRRFVIKENTKKIAVCMCLFVSVFLMLSFRHQSMGLDLFWKYETGYLGWFDKLSRISFGEIPQYLKLTNYDFGFVLLNKIIGLFSNDRQIFLSVCAFLSVIPYVFFVYKNSDSPFISFAIFIGLPSFLYFYGTLRQSIAMGFVVLALSDFFSGKNKKAFFWIVVSSFFHITSLVALLIYPIIKIKNNDLFWILSIFIIGTVYILREPLLQLLLPYIKGGGYEISKGSGEFWFFFLFLIYVFLVIFSKNFKHEKKYILGCKILWLSCFFMLFQGVTPVAARFAFYFTPALLVLIPIYLKTIHSNTTRSIVKFLLFVLLFSFGLYRIYLGGFDFALSYPYKWFFDNVKEVVF
ncbi:MAG: EpsG family protein [Clostridia bacterium]|nr:EpsG family protein [Clostridia bacterium]